MKVLIMGGAGFIGINAAKRFLQLGHEVIIFDNLCYKGADLNLRWLGNTNQLTVIRGDIRDAALLNEIFSTFNQIDVVLHLAAQVAVTTSIYNPREDFTINALGTFNLLEAIRQSQHNPILIYSSTNKVYGQMSQLAVREGGRRYEYEHLKNGINEEMPLDFYSPYGCSKGAADQYVKDYSRIYNLNTIVFRQSCIYGYRQFGREDQGWLAWFIIAAVLDKPIKIYGDGKQVRDILFIDDLIDAYILGITHAEKIVGDVYNIGGGPSNTLSLLELIVYLESLLDKKISLSFHDWRPGDQKVFICDISKATNDFAWYPKIGVKEGIQKLLNWVIENRDELITVEQREGER